MSIVARLVFLGLFLLAPTFAAAPAAAPETAADRELAAFTALRRAQPPAGLREMNREQRARWMEETQQKVIAAGLAFYEAHPSDPRRWEVVMALLPVAPQFVKEYGPGYEQANAKPAAIDEAAKAAWTAKVAQLRAAMEAAADVPAVQREELDWGAYAKRFRDTTAAMRAGEPVDWAAFRGRFDAHVAKYRGLDAALVRRSDDYLGALDRNVPGAALKEWAYLQETSPNAALRQHAADKVKAAAALAKPLEIAFTAVDGRKVDLKDLRGKVVLVDFWATWCGPCIAELPNVKKVYAAYHEHGFEVIGIALENARLLPADTPEQAAAKLAAASKVLTDFTAKEAMPWPQYFDGKYWKNEISTRFDIRGIPAMFLLDQEGKVVSTNARGETLEREVKRLLKR